MIDEGKAYTPGNNFRSRAEAQQRRFRAQILQLGYGEHAHWLKEEDDLGGLRLKKAAMSRCPLPQVGPTQWRARETGDIGLGDQFNPFVLTKQLVFRRTLWRSAARSLLQVIAGVLDLERATGTYGSGIRRIGPTHLGP